MFSTSIFCKIDGMRILNYLASDSNNDNTITIAGIVVGGIVMIVAVALAIILSV